MIKKIENPDINSNRKCQRFYYIMNNMDFRWMVFREGKHNLKILRAHFATSILNKN